MKFSQQENGGRGKRITDLVQVLFFVELSLLLVFGGIAAFRGQDVLLKATFWVGLASWLVTLFSFVRGGESGWFVWRGVLLFVTSWLVFPLFKAIRQFWIHTTYDNLLLGMDRQLWGGRSLPERVMGLESWGVSEALSTGYFLFYFVVLCPVIWAAVKRKTAEGQIFLQGIALMYLIGFLGYCLVPAGGPYLAFPEVFPYPPQGGAMTGFLVGLVAKGITGMDVFPSLHSGISVFVLGYFWLGKYRIASFLLAPVVGSILFATVYLRYHYGVDLICGMVLAGVVLVFVQWLRARCSDDLNRKDL